MVKINTSADDFMKDYKAPVAPATAPAPTKPKSRSGIAAWIIAGLGMGFGLFGMRGQISQTKAGQAVTRAVAAAKADDTTSAENVVIVKNKTTIKQTLKNAHVEVQEQVFDLTETVDSGTDLLSSLAGAVGAVQDIKTADFNGRYEREVKRAKRDREKLKNAQLHSRLKDAEQRRQMTERRQAEREREAAAKRVERAAKERQKALEKQQKAAERARKEQQRAIEKQRRDAERAAKKAALEAKRAQTRQIAAVKRAAKSK